MGQRQRTQIPTVYEGGRGGGQSEGCVCKDQDFRDETKVDEGRWS